MILLSFEMLACVVDALLAGWFISSFCKHNFFNKNVIIFIVFYSIFNISNLFTSIFSGFSLSTIINILGLTIFALSCKNAKIFIRFLSVFIFEVILTVTNFLIVTNTLIVTVFGYVLGEEILVILNDQGIVRLTILIMSKMFIFTALSIIKKLVSEGKRFKYQDYFLFIIFPITFFCVLTVMIKISLNYNISKLYVYYILAIFAVVFTYVGIYYLVYKINKTNKAEYEKEFYKKLLKYQQRHYLEAEENFKQIKQIKHDIKNSLLSVEANLKNSETAEAQKKLEKILNSVSNIGNCIKSQNQVVDFVLNSKLNSLTDNAIVVTGELSDLSHIDDIDLSIVLGNVVDNAIEAISKITNPKIEIQFYKKNNYQSILIKNVITESVLAKNPDLKSTKKNSNEHGIGIKSAKDIIIKYGGTIDIFEEENFFNVHIALPLTNQN